MACSPHTYFLSQKKRQQWDRRRNRLRAAADRMNWDSHRRREQNVPEAPATHLEPPLTFHWCIFTVFLTYCTLTISVTLLQISHFKKNNTWTPSAQHFCHKIKSTLRGLHFYQRIFCLTSHHFRLINAWPLYNLAYYTFTIPPVSSSSLAHFNNGKSCLSFTAFTNQLVLFRCDAL